MTPNDNPDPGSSGSVPPRHDPSQSKNHLMALADQVDRAHGGSSFPRVLRSPLGALGVLLLVVAVVVWIGFHNFL